MPSTPTRTPRALLSPAPRRRWLRFPSPRSPSPRPSSPCKARWQSTTTISAATLARRRPTSTCRATWARTLTCSTATRLTPPRTSATSSSPTPSRALVPTALPTVLASTPSSSASM
eukprot:Amastigsp_a339220_11933.p5 type:complete len:116 gc:universal Amastigsp_a339220_11933:782-435(-)